ncbi:hypothetical protein [Undibacterium sp. WLHG33]|uniref:hypothetical protein n=1 Tax=Undibacterium sp. WLHG33 TaxID=3412482 RepID=UPI003C30DB10
MVKTSSKVGGKLVGVKRLKVDTWFAAVMQASQQTKIEPLVEFLSINGLNTNRDKWDRCKNSEAVPLASFVLEVDKVLPGTASILMAGVDKLPLWKVLDKDESVCKRTVSSLLADARLYQSGKSVAQKCHSLLEYMVEFQFGDTWSCSHRDLDKLVASPTQNEIAKSCKAKNLDRRTMLAIVALWILAQSGRDQKAINYTDYFLLGILEQPLTERFGKPIADFVLDMYREAG